jgi:hypothetical protein
VPGGAGDPIATLSRENCRVRPHFPLIFPLSAAWRDWYLLPHANLHQLVGPFRPRVTTRHTGGTMRPLPPLTCRPGSPP